MVLTTFLGLRVTSELVAAACLAGSLEISQLIYENDTRVLEQKGVTEVGHHVEWGDLTMSAAVQGRRSDIVWWLQRRFPDADFDRNAALWSALKMGGILVAEWLISRGFARLGNRAQHAPVRDIAAQGRVDVLQWLAERVQLDGVAGLVAKAAENGRLDAVRWLIECGQVSESRAASFSCEVHLGIHLAAVKGHFEVAKYLRGYTQSNANYLRQDYLHG